MVGTSKSKNCAYLS